MEERIKRKAQQVKSLWEKDEKNHRQTHTFQMKNKKGAKVKESLCEKEKENNG